MVSRHSIYHIPVHEISIAVQKAPIRPSGFLKQTDLDLDNLDLGKKLLTDFIKLLKNHHNPPADPG